MRRARPPSQEARVRGGDEEPGGGGGEQREINSLCRSADGWSKGTLFYPVNFLFLDPPYY